jgi:hypothetical protein
MSASKQGAGAPLLTPSSSLEDAAGPTVRLELVQNIITGQYNVDKL